MAAVAIADSTLGVDGQQYCENGARFNEQGTCDTCDSVHLADILGGGQPGTIMFNELESNKN